MPDDVMFEESQGPQLEAHYGKDEPECLRNKSFDNNIVDVYQDCDNTTRSWMFGSNTGRWTYLEWLLTNKPHVLGLVDGLAYPTGVSLLFILTIMVFCSLPFIRRGGHFEVITAIEKNAIYDS